MPSKSGIELLIPQACPVELIRIGGNGDGAYLVPNDLQGIDACFSPGVNNFKHFEDELSLEHGIHCHMCDFSSDVDRLQTPLIDDFQTFDKKWLDIDGADDSISLNQWVSKYCPSSACNLMLQMDIEGAEYRNLLGADQSLLDRFRIIVIELHGLETFRDGGEATEPILGLIKKLSLNHVCVHAHPNNCSTVHIDSMTGMNIPSIIELTYLRKDRLDQIPHRYDPQIPHPLDISRNVSFLPPIHLNEFWLRKDRSMASENKILSDRLGFSESIVEDLSSTLRRRTSKLCRVYKQSVNNLASLYESRGGLDLQQQRESSSFGEELASGKKYCLSSGFGNYPEAGEVHDSQDFFFHTSVNENQSITVDLECTYRLGYLIIVNRKDSHQERAQALFYVIHRKETFSRKKALPLLIGNQFYNSDELRSITPLLGQKGRFITIFSPLRTALHFSELKIYKHKKISKTS